MPGMNPSGVPYPLDSDPIADWPAILTEMVGTLRAVECGEIFLSDGGTEPSSLVVPLTSGLFPAPPVIQLTAGTGAAGVTNMNLWVSGAPTVDHFTAAMSRSTTTTVKVFWLAVGRP